MISHIGEIDTIWLNGVLCQAGAIGAGAVRSFTAEPLQSVNSRLAAIQVEYEPG